MSIQDLEVLVLPPTEPLAETPPRLWSGKETQPSPQSGPWALRKSIQVSQPIPAQAETSGQLA